MLRMIFLREILYKHNVVVRVVNCNGLIYGGAMQCAVTFWETDRANICL